jgi:hypothetical protein
MVGGDGITEHGQHPGGANRLDRLRLELPAGAREVRWRMPAVAARRARLVLRAGGEGGEWESAPSAPFALAALPEGELSRVLQGRSEAGGRVESSAGSAGAASDLVVQACSTWLRAECHPGGA